MAKLNRKDLVKDFEDIVKQEIKNHSDSLSYANQAVTDLKQKVQDIKFQHEKLNSDLFERHNAHKTLEDVLSCHEKLIQKVNGRVSDLNELLKSSLQDIKKSAECRESYYMTLSDFNSFKDKMDEWLSKIRCLFEVQKSDINQGIDKASQAHKPFVESLKSEFRKYVSERDLEIKEIESQLDIFSVNFSGLKEETELLKKRTYIIEKNLENIYTQIDRLKGALQR